jgi:hypothetical protein
MHATAAQWIAAGAYWVYVVWGLWVMGRTRRWGK